MATKLRFRLENGVHAIPLSRVHRVAGFASLAGAPDEYFLGWLRFHGKPVPVFDLNRVVCDASTPEEFGSRIILVESGENADVPLVGLLAAGVTDTCAGDDAGVQALNLDMYLQMLSNFIPSSPPSQPK